MVMGEKNRTSGASYLRNMPLGRWVVNGQGCQHTWTSSYLQSAGVEVYGALGGCRELK